MNNCAKYNDIYMVTYYLDAVDLSTTLFSCNLDPNWDVIVVYFDGKCRYISAWIVDV